MIPRDHVKGISNVFEKYAVDTWHLQSADCRV